MTRRYLRSLLLGSVFALSACAQQSEVRQLHQDVSTLNNEMAKLNKETVKITQQNALNAKSTNGVYLLPGSNTPARLNSQIGMLRMTLKTSRQMRTARGPRCEFRGSLTIHSRHSAAP